MITFSSLNIIKKFGVLAGVVAVAVALLLTVFLISEKSVITQERQQGVQQAVESVSGVLTYYQGLAAKGAMPESQAQQMALATIKTLRYGQNDYFWINDMQGRMVMHPISPGLDGTEMLNTTDPDGKFVFAEMIRVVNEHQAGFVRYIWEKPGHHVSVAKVSFVKGFAPWGWVIGSGVYLDTVDAIFWQRVVEFSFGAVMFMAMLLGFLYLLARSIAVPIQKAVDVAKTVAAGDLTSSFHIVGQDETAQLLTALQHMNHSLTHLVGEVRDSADIICTASDQIASGNQDLSERTENQASSLEETAASMEQLTATVKQNADHARQANSLAVSAAAVANHGGNVVLEVVGTMGSIHDSSRKIVDIIAVIDSIAFQTNILALNAAVEAARAGEQGRGFAVVATEVRNLARRSSEAAKQIKDLIDDSVVKIDSGTKLVDHAGTTMKEIVASIQRVADIMGEISIASAEQTTGIEQVNRAIVQMDEVTQQNAALVEESASAAQSMLGRATDLSKAVGVFKLKSGG